MDGDIWSLLIFFFAGMRRKRSGNVKVPHLGTMIPYEKIFHSPYLCEILFIPNWD